MKIKAMTMGIVIFILIFGGIGVTLAVDLWSTTSDKTPVKFKEGELQGSYNPADIRGSYTFAEVAELFEINLQVLYQAFDIPLDTVGTEIQTKDLENLYADAGVDIGNGSVQIFVALYKKLPIDLDETYLPQPAADLIAQTNTNLTQEQKEYLETHTIEVIGKEVASTETKTGVSEESESLVNGAATFQKVLDAGVTKEEVEKILGRPMPPSNQTVRDYCMEAGLSFSQIKEQLNKLIE